VVVAEHVKLVAAYCKKVQEQSRDLDYEADVEADRRRSAFKLIDGDLG
jgi:hypothetical protein